MVVASCMPCAAVKVMVCAAPGVTVSVEGDAVTPCGSPLKATLTWPVKPLKASAEMLKGVDDPAVSESVGLGAARAKSACPVGVVAVCVVDPEVAVTVIATGPAVTLEFAVIVTVCEAGELLAFFTTSDDDAADGVSVNVAGEAETPDGKPESVKLTALEKPFVPVTEMEIVCVEFGVIVTEGKEAIAKPGCGVGVDVGVVPFPPLPPPQPITVTTSSPSKANPANFAIRAIPYSGEHLPTWRVAYTK